MSAKEKLATLFPERTVNVAGVDFSIRPFSFGEILKLTAILGEAAADLAELKISGISYGENGLNIDPETMVALTAFVGKHSDKVNKMVAMSVQVDGEALAEADVASLPPDVGLELSIEVFMQNKGFFTERVLPLIKARLNLKTLQKTTGGK